ncbi:zinc finger protein 28-like [Acanthaster planci]|uniref:Zinc finger protein 28-like n=1 Tax=Acanthaster planci TaxID=133434 RepID=A0A8B7YUL3_ACAPL|nr:zinc finger protein 28-like [Acanthaster planci]
MEDPNNNEDFAFVPDFMMPDLMTSKDLSIGLDEQSVPVFHHEGCPAEDQLSPVTMALQAPHLPVFDSGSYGTSGSGPDHQLLNRHQTMEIGKDLHDQTYDTAFFPHLSANWGATPANNGEPAAHHSASSSSSLASALNCPLCRRSFKHKLSLTNHQRSHSAREPHLCTICGETFKYKTNFKRHWRIHAKEMKTCRYCGTNMDSDYDLVQHEKAHRRQEKQL